MIFHGLRDAGKTVLLNTIRQHVSDRGIACARIEVEENRSLPASLVPVLRAT